MAGCDGESDGGASGHMGDAEGAWIGRRPLLASDLGVATGEWLGDSKLAHTIGLACPAH